MRKLYNFEVGNIIDDLTIVEIVPCTKGSGSSTKYRVVCNVCHREKMMTGPCLAKHIGTTHTACGKGIKLKDKAFYNHWCAMRTRTTNPNQDHWKDYGGRGINSDKFANFVDFYDGLYESYKEARALFGEKNVSLERVDVDGHYCVENCKWIHVADQKGNQRKTIYFEITFPDGHSEVCRNVRKFARDHGLNASSLNDLINGRLQSLKGYRGHRVEREGVTTK